MGTTADDVKAKFIALVEELIAGWRGILATHDGTPDFPDEVVALIEKLESKLALFKGEKQ